MSATTLARNVTTLPLQVIEATRAMLKKAEASPNAASLPEAKLVDDMLPLSFQIHNVADLVSKGVSRSTGQEPAALTNDLKTFADFYARLDLAEDLAKKADAELVNKREGETVTMGLGPGKSIDLPTGAYIHNYMIPNLYFHFNMAYAILRKEGVDIGKMVYIAPFMKDYIPN